MKLIYVAHPVAAPTPEGVVANLERAKRWLKFLLTQEPEICYIAPWITEVEIFDDGDPAAREAGIKRCCGVVEHCDGIILVGGTLTKGMLRERDTAARSDCEVLDWTHFGEEPPVTP